MKTKLLLIAMAVGLILFEIYCFHIKKRAGYGSCFRCGKTWDVVEGHMTMFTDSEACFPLCEKCWTELKTPANRMPYYAELWRDWCQGEVDYVYHPDLSAAKHLANQIEETNKWPEISKAVLEGK